MSHVSEQAVGFILDNYADVIEGGNAWRGSGTSYRGIPGTRSHEVGDDTPITAPSGGTTTTVVAESTRSWEESRWVKTNAPGYFLVARSAALDIVDAARRITGWNDTTKVFTVDAFPAASSSGDVFDVRQGFKRMPDGVDILEMAGDGFDRFFDLRVNSAGIYQEWYGAGLATYVATLELRLRMRKAARAHEAQASAFENLALIRPILCRGDHRDGTYTQALLPTGGQPEILNVSDASKVVVVDRYVLRYRINTTFR